MYINKIKKPTRGEQTKQRILDASKVLFYENGYNETTIQSIADLAQSTLGGITYHFSSKEMIASSIFNEYIRRLYEALFASEAKSQSWLFLHYVVTFNYYSRLFADANMVRFYRQILNDYISSYDMYYDTYQRIYYSLAEEAHVKLTSVELEATIVADLGARHEFFLQYHKGTIKMPILEAAAFIFSNTARMLRIPENIITDTAELALAYDQKHPMDHIKILI